MPFTAYTYNGYTACFLFSISPFRTWTTSKTYCESINGTLANFETQEEFETAQNSLKTITDAFMWVNKN